MQLRAVLINKITLHQARSAFFGGDRMGWYKICVTNCPNGSFLPSLGGNMFHREGGILSMVLYAEGI